MDKNAHWTIHADSVFEDELKYSLTTKYTKIEARPLVPSSSDKLQTVMYFVSSASLIMSILRLILDLKKKHTDKYVSIICVSGNESYRLVIKAGQQFDIDKMIREFLSNRSFISKS